MTVNQITQSQQALFYKLLANDMSLTTNTNSTSLLSGYNSNSNDLSPYLSMALYNNYSSNMFSSLMNMFMNYFMQIIMMMFMQNMNTSSGTETVQTPSETPVHEARDIIKLTNDNLDSDLRNQKGTTYVIACGDGCGRCIRFEPIIEAVNNNLNSSTTFYKINPDKQNKLYQTLKKESGADTSKSYGYPIIIKCVDGEAKEFYSYSDISGIYTDEEKMTEWFANKM